jgi:hypothetical protein
MFLLAEIILTIIAWTKGWKWRSLIPLAVGVFLGITLGFLWVLFGGDPESPSVTGIGIILDLILIGFLVYMVSKPPKKTNI